MISLLEQTLLGAGIKITTHELLMFERYEALLLERNRKINLTSITDKEGIAVKHFYDSLTLLDFLPKASPGCGIRLIDIGSGAGFPGVPLKIMRSDLNLTLMDCLKKRVMFLKCLVNELALEDTQCIHARAEEYDPERFESYGFAVSRAVAPLDVLSVYALGYVRPGGRFIAMKGPDTERETRDAEEYIKQMGGEIHSVSNIVLPVSGAGRSMILIDKTCRTPPGLPKKLLKKIKLDKMKGLVL